MMRTRVGQWGSSCAVRLPKMAVETLDLRPGSPVTLAIENGALVIRSDRPVYRLDDLVAEARQQKAPRSLDDIAVGREQL